MSKHFSSLPKRGLLFVVALLMLAGCMPAEQESGASRSTPAGPEDGALAVSAGDGVEDLPDIAAVVARVKPSVVAISTEFVTNDVFNRPRTQQAGGSGWILSEDGLIVTNNHVVEDAETVSVTLHDGETYEAEETYTDPLTDLAVMRIAASGLPVADIGDSSKLEVGNTVVAIGDSLGMGISATSGIASATGVSLEQSGQNLLDLIQTDAAINPGNSGGPLVNMAGQVVGINSIKIASVGVEGMGYAISINQALPVIKALVEEGRVVRPWLGVGLYTVNPVIARRYELAVDAGVLVSEVVENSPADRSGLKAGDVIVRFDEIETPDVHSLTDAILSHEVGDTVEITYWRGEDKETTSATLGETPA